MTSRESLSDVAARLLAERKAAQNRCPVGRYLSTLTADERADLDSLLRDRQMPASIIVEALAPARPFEEPAIQAHRRALSGQPGCKCP